MLIAMIHAEDSRRIHLHDRMPIQCALGPLRSRPRLSGFWFCAGNNSTQTLILRTSLQYTLARGWPRLGFHPRGWLALSAFRLTVPARRLDIRRCRCPPLRLRARCFALGTLALGHDFGLVLLPHCLLMFRLYALQSSGRLDDLYVQAPDRLFRARGIILQPDQQLFEPIGCQNSTAGPREPIKEVVNLVCFGLPSEGLCLASECGFVDWAVFGPLICHLRHGEPLCKRTDPSDTPSDFLR